jgi:opacity protein-like surface antigen
MKKFAFLAVVLAVVLALPAFATAQAKPDFSGKWIQDMEKSDQGGGGRGPAGPQSLTVTQSATELTIERETPNGTMKTVYKLDGTESENSTGRGTSKTKSTWDGAKLVTAGSQTMNMQGNEVTMEMKEVRSLEADGTMVVVTTTQSQMGERTRKVVFKKA